MKQLSDLLEDLLIAPAVLVRVQQAQGSVPRDTGTWMAVFDAHQVGTIGGGHLEHQAIAQARAALQNPDLPLPEAPSSTTNSPRAMSSDTSRSAITSTSPVR